MCCDQVRVTEQRLASRTCGVCIRSWLLAKGSEVRGKPLQLGRTYHRRRTLRKMKTAGKATGNHSGKHVTRETEYTAVSFCGVDMPLPLLIWSITSD